MRTGKTIAAHAVFFALMLASAAAQSSSPGSEASRRADALLGKMTIEQKIDYIGGTGFAIRAMPDLGLPALEMSDGPIGVRSNEGFPSTVYAAGIGLAASWNHELAERVGTGIGKDARARGIHFMLGPGVNIYRSPRNSRNFEYFGEDPFLASSIAVGYITGMQQQGVSSTVKHYMGNNSEFLRNSSDSIIDERTLREIYLPAFEAAVKQAHVGAIMDSYNLTNGAHMTQNGYFNTEIARKEWGFQGVMMSDWGATHDAIAAANGGLDLEMPNGEFMNRANLLPAIKDGKVTSVTIDEKIRHILITADRFGWLDPDHQQTDPSLSTYNLSNQAIALDAARESIVLLKNGNNLLPLDKSKIKSVLVVGPDAYPGVAAGGGSGRAIPFRTIGALEGISAYLGSGATVYYERGLPTITDLARDTEFTTEAQNGQPGVTVQLFTNAQLSGSPASTQTLRHINATGVDWETVADNPEAMAAWSAAGARHQASRRWTGYYTAKQSGPYVVALQAEGEGHGNRLYVDDKPVFDNWNLVHAWQPHVTLNLTAGPHKVVVEDGQSSPFGGRLRVGIAPQSELVSAHAKALAAKADVVVIAAGFDQDSESEGGDRTFDLPFGQDELIQAMASANKNTIVTVSSGGNVDSSAWLDQVPGYLELWYPGEAGGTALAEVLFGDIDPSGHLPATFERHAEDNPTYNNYYPEPGTNRIVYKEGVFVGYRGYEHNGVKPLYPFGYGLSYTTFKYADLRVKPDSTASGPHYTVSFDVTNTGGRSGATVAQVYVADPHGAVPEPPKQLEGFDKAFLKPGETRHVSVPLDARAFSYYDTGAKAWKIAPGKFGILVGQSSEQIDLKSSVSISEAVAGSAND